METITGDWVSILSKRFQNCFLRYYKRRLAPKIDIRLVVLTLITVMSMVQYYSSWYNHSETIKYLATLPSYRLRALEPSTSPS